MTPKAALPIFSSSACCGSRLTGADLSPRSAPISDCASCGTSCDSAYHGGKKNRAWSSQRERKQLMLATNCKGLTNMSHAGTIRLYKTRSHISALANVLPHRGLHPCYFPPGCVFIPPVGSAAGLSHPSFHPSIHPDPGQSWP
jgi:hypothetical protein